MPASAIAVIGCGNMGRAIVHGLLKSSAASSEIIPDVFLLDPDQAKVRELCLAAEQVNLRPVENVRDLQGKVDTIIIAVKPGVVREILWQIMEVEWSVVPTVISVAAGVSVRALFQVLGDVWPVARVMPNLPCTIGVGAIGYYCQANTAGSLTSSGERVSDIVEQLFSPLGLVVRVEKEQLLEAVTGLSGSGPAYVFLMIEALADGGVKAGLTRVQAQSLAVQTVLGAASYVQQSGKHPGELKDMVSSPGGTTIAALHVLENVGFRGALISAVEKAAERAQELSKD